MTRALAALALALVSIGAAPASRIGFVDLPKALARHPLHAVLAQYDREIASLRATEHLTGLERTGDRTQRSLGALARDVATARSQLHGFAATYARTARARENAALAAVLALARGPQSDVTAFQSDLTRADAATFDAFSSAAAQRTARAFAARKQQLHEQELAYGFELAREHAGRRLVLRLKLRELHLEPPERAALQGELASIDARQARALATMQHVDDGVLSAYRRQLLQAQTTAIQRMAGGLETKAAADLTLRDQLRTAPTGTLVAQLPARLRAFRSAYHPAADAATSETAFTGASADLTIRFSALRSSDEASRRQTTAQIAALQARREALERAMSEQIVRDARRLAAARHLTQVVAGGKQPRGSVDLTAAVAADLAAF